jgi:asparagine synthase (glutamine-hydrolysing)
MCGICGIARHDRREPDPDTLLRMTAAIAHRGPDGDGFYCRPGIGLGVRRLAIIDVAGGDQPISNEDGSLWIVYNGESFNFPELHAELKKRGHTFRTKTDTECVLHLYEEYGDDCMRHLRGQFAFALWDEKKQRLLIARDRMGQKPLYYTIQNGVLYFGSELSCIYAVLPQRPEISLQAIDLYLSLQYIPEPLTIYEGVHKLPAAHRMVWQDGRLQIEP